MADNVTAKLSATAIVRTWNARCATLTAAAFCAAAAQSLAGNCFLLPTITAAHPESSLVSGVRVSKNHQDSETKTSNVFSSRMAVDGGTHRVLGSPTEALTATNRLPRQTCLVRPIASSEFFAKCGVKPNVTTIPALMLLQEPAAVRRLIVAIWVDSIQSASVWAFSHVGKETEKGFIPSLANRNSATAIVFVVFVSRIQATIAHGLPGAVGWVLLASSRSPVCCVRDPIGTATTFTCPVFQRLPSHFAFNTATATAKPVRSSVAFGNFMQNGPGIEGLACQVSEIVRAVSRMIHSHDVSFHEKDALLVRTSSVFATCCSSASFYTAGLEKKEVGCE